MLFIRYLAFFLLVAMRLQGGESVVTTVTLWGDREAIAVRERALAEIERQASLEEERLTARIELCGRQRQLLAELSNQGIADQELLLKMARRIQAYVQAVAKNGNHAVSVPGGSRTLRGISQDITERLSAIESLKQRTKNRVNKLWIPGQGAMTEAALVQTLANLEQRREHFRVGPDRGTVVIKFPGSLGRVRGDQIHKAMAFHHQQEKDSAQAIALGGFVVSRVPVLGSTSGRDIGERIDAMKASQGLAAKQLEAGQQYIFRHGLGDRTRQWVEGRIGELRRKLELGRQEYSQHRWMAIIPGLGRRNVEDIMLALGTYSKAINDHDTNVLAGTFEAPVPGFRESLSREVVAQRLQDLAGHDDTTSLKQRHKIERALTTIADYASLTRDLLDIERERLNLGLSAMSALFTAWTDSIHTELAELQRFLPEFDVDHRELLRQQESELSWLELVRDTYIPR